MRTYTTPVAKKEEEKKLATFKIVKVLHDFCAALEKVAEKKK